MIKKHISLSTGDGTYDASRYGDDIYFSLDIKLLDGTFANEEKLNDVKENVRDLGAIVVKSIDTSVENRDYRITIKAPDEYTAFNVVDMFYGAESERDTPNEEIVYGDKPIVDSGT